MVRQLILVVSALLLGACNEGYEDGRATQLARQSGYPGAYAEPIEPASVHRICGGTDRQAQRAYAVGNGTHGAIVCIALGREARILPNAPPAT